MIGDGVGNPLELLIIVRRLVHDVLVLQPLEDGPLDRYPGVIGHVRHYRSRRRGRPELPRSDRAPTRRWNVRRHVPGERVCIIPLVVSTPKCGSHFWHRWATPTTMSHMVVGDDAAFRESLLMRGVLDMCVLALLDGESLHAYGIVRRLQGHGFANVSYGTIYPLVTRLKRQGLVDQQLEESPSGPARNVLAINATGRRTLRLWSEQWRHTTDVTRQVLAPRYERQRTERHVG